MILAISYDPILVTLSACVSILTSYTALSILRQTQLSGQGDTSMQAISISAVALGMGIWSMHFVAMLALKLPIPVLYDQNLTLLSMSIAVIASFIALTLVNRYRSRLVRIGAGVLLGLGIAAMHYTGMMAMKLSAEVNYNPVLVAISIVIAVATTTSGLFVADKMVSGTMSNGIRRQILFAVVMNFGIVGMHYTGMLAVTFTSSKEFIATASSMAFDHDSIGFAIVSVLAVLMYLALRTAYTNRLWTERVLEAIQKANLSEKKYHTILSSAVDGMVTINADGLVQDFNAAAERLFGYRQDEVLGQNINMLMPEPYAASHDGYIRAYLNTGIKRVIGIGREVIGKRKDGSTFPMNLSVSQYEVAGDPQFVGIVRDISDSKELLENLEEARSVAERANRAKSDFLSAMSHEIRTPMNGIIGMSDTLSQTSLKGSQIDMVKLISESAHSLLEIIDSILDFSKIEAGKLEIERNPMQVADVVEKTCLLLDYMARKKNVELTMFIDPGIPEKVLGDALRVRQVLLNLVSNAIKFSGGQLRSGHVSVRVLLIEHNQEQVTVEIQVADDGIGIDEASQSKIFEPFDQADLSTTRRFGGTGLGLPIARHLVEMMGGEITLQSTPGKGATFTVILPLISQPKKSDFNRPSPDISGLSCFVIGGVDSLAEDFEIYLKAAGALVERISDLDAVLERVCIIAPSLMVWIIDARHEKPSLAEIRAAALACPNFDIRLVFVGRGKRRNPRQEDKDLVIVDGNVLRRQTLTKAVAVAAGITPPEVDTLPDKIPSTAIIPLSREEALQERRLILVAEDNETNQQVILKQLSLLGIFADIADNGRDAFERWKQNDYALVLTDLHMPDMDGYALAAAIRAEETDLAHVPIIAYSSSIAHDKRDSALDFDDWLRKPVPLETLRVTMVKWLGDERAT